MSEALTQADRGEERAFAELTTLVMAWSLVGWLGWHLIEASGTAQWDLSVYRRAGQAFRAGLDPYAEQALPFVYPPVVLPLCGLLSRLPEAVSFWLWLLAKAGCVFVMLRVARRYFEPFHHDAASIVFLVLAFNGALYTDVLAGNVSLFEQALLWGGAAAFLRGRYALFVLLVVLGAQFKLTPAALLLLVPALLPRRQWIWFLAGSALMLTGLALQWLAWPSLTQAFLQRAAMLDERGQLNPCSLAVGGEVAHLLAAIDPFWEGRGVVIYAAAALGICAVAVSTVRKRRRWLQENPAWCACFLMCTYALVVPRFKDYSYVLLLIPAWFALKRLKRPAWAGWLPLIVVVPQGLTFLPTGDLVGRSFEYASWIAAVTLFALLVSHLRQQVSVESTA